MDCARRGDFQELQHTLSLGSSNMDVEDEAGELPLCFVTLLSSHFRSLFNSPLLHTLTGS